MTASAHVLHPNELFPAHLHLEVCVCPHIPRTSHSHTQTHTHMHACMQVLARMTITADVDGGGVVLKIGIRSEDKDVSQLLMDSIA